MPALLIGSVLYNLRLSICVYRDVPGDRFSVLRDHPAQTITWNYRRSSID